MPGYGAAAATYGAPGGTYGDLGGSSSETLTALTISRAGVAPVFAAATAEGDRVRPSSRMVLIVHNAGASPVTVEPQPTFVNVIGLASLPIAVSVPAGATRMIGPWPRDFYAAADGLMSVTYSSAADVTICALDLGP